MGPVRRMDPRTPKVATFAQWSASESALTLSLRWDLAACVLRAHRATVLSRVGEESPGPGTDVQRQCLALNGPLAHPCMNGGPRHHREKTAGKPLSVLPEIWALLR